MISNKSKILINRVIIGFVIISCLGFFSESINAQSKKFRWDYVGKDMDERKFYIDLISFGKINFKKPIRNFWIKIEFVDGSYHLYYQNWDCQREQAKALSYAAYTAKGSLLDRKDYQNDPWIKPPPDSIGETILSRACSTKKSTNSKSDTNSKTSKDYKITNVKVIAKMANVRSGPSMDSEILDTASRDTIFQLVDTKSVSGWFKIQFTRTTTAWVHGNTIEFVEAEGEN